MKKLEKIENAGLKGIWRAVKHNAITGQTVSDKVYENTLVTIGRQTIAMQAAGTNTEEFEVQYLAVGTGSTAVANGDTKMEFEVARKARGSGAVSGIEASIAAFFSTSDIPDKTYTRFAAFADGGITASSAGADSGILVSHVEVIETVSATQTLTLTFRLSVNDGG